jgi:hypothetical protein
MLLLLPYDMIRMIGLNLTITDLINFVNSCTVIYISPESEKYIDITDSTDSTDSLSQLVITIESVTDSIGF